MATRPTAPSWPATSRGSQVSSHQQEKPDHGIRQRLLGQWDLAADGRDGSGNDRHAVVHGSVAFGPSLDHGRSGSVARIVRGHGHLEVSGIRDFGETDFTIGLWVNAAPTPTAALGDLASFFDPTDRRGFNLGFQHGAVCGSQRADRNLFWARRPGSP